MLWELATKCLPVCLAVGLSFLTMGTDPKRHQSLLIYLHWVTFACVL